MPGMKDGPSTGQFKALALRGNVELSCLRRCGISKVMAAQVKHAPVGSCTAWGIPFRLGKAVLVKDKAVSVSLAPIKGQ